MRRPPGYIFISHQHLSNTMNAISWYQYLMVFFCVLIAIYGIPGCFADPVPDSSALITPDETSSIPVDTPTPKVTIAPIHTREPEVKPPVENPVKPGLTPTLQPPVQSPTPRPKVTPTPDITPSISATTPSTGNNESAETYYQWGLAYADVGNCDAALEEFEKAIARDPYYADAWYHRAICYEKLGMYDEAYDSYRFLLTIDPGFFSGENASTSHLTTNITPGRVLPPPDGDIPLVANPLFLILIGIGLGGLIISGLLIYHIRRRLPLKGAGTLPRTSSGPDTDQELERIADQVGKCYYGDRTILVQVIKLAIEIAREGREGSAVGTAFVLGDSDAVMERSRQLILNPLAGHSPSQRLITNPDMRENIKELSLLDGAFVIREDGTVEAAGRYISIDTSRVKLSKGFGTRHVSVAAITQETKAIGIVVSESGGQVRIMARGRIICETS